MSHSDITPDSRNAFWSAAKRMMEDAGVSGTLRDHFAAMALSGILANHECMRQLMAKSASGNLDRSTRDCVADMAYNYADAMIERRQEGAAHNG